MSLPDTSMPTCCGVDIEDSSIADLQQFMTQGIFGARDLTACYLERIKQLNGLLKCVLCVLSITPRPVILVITM